MYNVQCARVTVDATCETALSLSSRQFDDGTLFRACASQQLVSTRSLLLLLLLLCWSSSLFSMRLGTQEKCCTTTADSEERGTTQEERERESEEDTRPLTPATVSVCVCVLKLPKEGYKRTTSEKKERESSLR